MTSMRFGYCRTSTKQQDLGIQREALLKAGVEPENIYEEQESGAKRNRPVLADVLSRLRKGDSFICWRFDRIARNASHLMSIVDDLKARGINFVSITEGFDISTPMGKAMLGIAAVFAEMEREGIEERREAGLTRAREKGVKFGRKLLSDPDSTARKSGDLAKAMLAVQGGMSVRQAAKAHGINRATLGRHLSRVSEPEVFSLVSKPKSKANGHLNGHAARVAQNDLITGRGIVQ
jgi:DNA invertase Pin-like site-specific DNA recombinase